MKIPARIKIGGHWIEIKKISECWELDGTVVQGSADHESNTICLASKHDGQHIAESRRAQTFCHEIVHHLAFHSGLDLDEREITAFSEVLFQVLRDNNLNFADEK